MATVPAFLKHSNIGKAKQAEPYTSSAHARYIMRKNAASVIYSERMPKQYHAVQRFLDEHEDGLRKNGRVIDKFIISIPHDVSQEDAVKALRSFGHRIGHDKAPFLFAIHGFDTRNHHAHFIFIDRDPETGMRVYGTSERNSSATIKIEWETAANETFQQLGYDVRIKVADGVQEEIANDNTKQDEPKQDFPFEEASEVDAPISADTPVEPEPEADKPEEIETPEETMAQTLAQALESFRQTANANPPPVQREAEISDVARRVRKIHADTANINHLHHMRDRMNEQQDRIAFLLREQEKIEQDAQKHWEESVTARGRSLAAKAQLDGLSKENGKLRGLKVRLLGIDFTSAKRQRAEHAAKEERERTMDADRAARVQDAYRQRMAQISEELQEAIEAADMLRNEMIGPHGKMEQLDDAEVYLKASVQRSVHGNGDASTELGPKEVWAAWEAGEITDDQVRAYCKQSGNDVMLTVFEAHIQDGEDDDGLSEDGQLQLEL